MPTVVRRGVFETNSSSSHVLAIGVGDWTPQKIYVHPGEVVKIEPGEFGWEQEVHSDFHSKASYALTHALNDGGPGYDDLRAIEAVPGKLDIAIQNSEIGNREHLEMLRRVIQKRLPDGVSLRLVPATRERIGGYSVGYSLGYVDHQSYIGENDAGGPIWTSDEILDNFLFNPKSAIITDNDNH